MKIRQFFGSGESRGSSRRRWPFIGVWDIEMIDEWPSNSRLQRRVFRVVETDRRYAQKAACMGDRDPAESDHDIGSEPPRRADRRKVSTKKLGCQADRPVAGGRHRLMGESKFIQKRASNIFPAGQDQYLDSSRF